MIGKNGLPMAASIGQKHSLVGKWPMADHYIVLCRDIAHVLSQRSLWTRVNENLWADFVSENIVKLD